MKCLHDRAKRLEPSVIVGEKKQRISLFFVQKITKTRTALTRESVAGYKSTAVFSYVQGVSEPLRRCLEQQGIRTVINSDKALRSRFMRPKDTVDPDTVAYGIPYECGQV